MVNILAEKPHGVLFQRAFEILVLLLLIGSLIWWARQVPPPDDKDGPWL